ncbi:hypothetical protein Ade02nite_71670 [Paractinoplanes deccanensis]|uniref:AAA+ ATPase domain-containing protein n=1 Tax=Paractinoplanes deccanensis TaxID=113561 RepID=A0ABQ3YEU0_9ACTN|nr:AAA family ATPase [Actinoplanes deccanensis]GID78526.1 hypothetical protein Ade02nite_71670 [Actinoplanes deccanensis]
MRFKGHFRPLAAALLVAVTGILTTLVGIAINGATGDEKAAWPGPLRLIQTNPWPSVIVLTAVGVLVAIPLWRLSSGSSETTTPSSDTTEDDREVAGLPEFVPGTLRDRRTPLDALTTKMTRDEGVFVQLVGAPGIGKTAIVAELLRNRPDNVGAGYLAVRGFPGVNAFSVLERLASAVSDPGDRQRLLERLSDGGSDLVMRSKDVLRELGKSRVWLVVDDAQDLFATGASEWLDEALGLVFDTLRDQREEHRVKVLFASEKPLPRPRDIETVSVTAGLPQEYFRAFVGDVAIPGAPAPRVGALAKATGRHPRTAELVLGIQAIKAETGPDPIDVASDSKALTRTLLSSLDEPRRRALRLLAILDRPVRPPVIAHLDGRPSDEVGDVRDALDQLVRCRLIRRYDDHYYVPGGESGRITTRIPEAEIASQRRKAAEYLAATVPGRDPVRLDDLEDDLHAVDLFVSAGDPGRAVRLMASLNDRYLLGWGQTAALTPWLTRVSGERLSFREQVLYVMLTGHALAQQGNLEKAIETVEGGVRMSAGPKPSTTYLAFLVQLAAYHFRAGQVAKAAEHYQTLLDQSPAGHKGVSTAHLGLAVCLVEAGAFAEADDHLDRAESDRHSADPDVVLPLLYLRALISFERGRDDESLARLEDLRKRAGNDRVMIARCDDLQAWVHLLRRDPKLAEDAARRAQDVAVRVGDPDLWSTAHTTLAFVELTKGCPGPALTAAKPATRYAQGVLGAEAFAMQGVAFLRDGNRGEPTRRAFAEAVELARALRETSPGSYRAYEIEGLALSGLALLQPERGEQPALDAYLAARDIVDLGGARFRRREFFATLIAGSPGNPLPRIKALLG